jgi:tetratricopeptide (TPR) repeat protein
MKNTNNNNILEQCDNLELKGRLTLSLTGCFLLLSVCALNSAVYADAILPQDTNTQIWIDKFLLPIYTSDIHPEQPQALANNSIAANLTANTGKLPPYLLEEANPTTDAAVQLWQERISISKEPKFNKNKRELQRIIDQISSISIDSSDQETESATTVDPFGADEPNDFSTDTDDMQEQKERQPAKVKYKMPKGHITKKTLEIFTKLSQHPEKLRNPLELAEILFKRNYLEQAAMCYRQALDRMNANQNQQPVDKAWVLFQLGNCLKNTEKSTALQMYGQLIEEYPDSPWTDMAKVKRQLIEWYMQNKPHSLIGKQ